MGTPVGMGVSLRLGIRRTVSDAGNIESVTDVTSIQICMLRQVCE
jgi:hypothetical protein